MKRAWRKYAVGLAVFLIVLVLYSMRSKISRSSVAFGSGNRLNTSDKAGAVGSDHDGNQKNSRSGNDPEDVKRRMVNEELAKSPLSVRGLSDVGKTYYALTDQDAAKINQLVAEVRLKIANLVTGGMRDLEDPKDSARVCYFRAAPEEAELIRSDFFKKLEAIGGSEFAKNGVAALQGDGRFLGAGNRDVYIHVNPGDATKSPTVEKVRLEIMTEDRTQSRDWEGPAETLKEVYLLDMDL